MTIASIEATKSAKPKSPPVPSSGAGAVPSSGFSPPSRKDRVPSDRAMNPSTLMPRKTDPMKGASMGCTLPDRYDDSAPRAHRFARAHPEDGVAGLLELVVGHADDHPAGERRAQVAHQRRGRRPVQVRGGLIEQDDVPVGQQR